MCLSSPSLKRFFCFIDYAKAFDCVDHKKLWKILQETKVHLVKAMVFPVVMYECESWTIKKMSAEELMFLNCGVGEDSCESLGLQGDPTSPS